MALSHELERVGNWFFRWRSYLPLLLAVLFLLALRDFTYLSSQNITNRLWELFCLVIASSGLAIRIMTVGYVPRGTSGRNTRKQVADVLNTTGMYSVGAPSALCGQFYHVAGDFLISPFMVVHSPHRLNILGIL